MNRRGSKSKQDSCKDNGVAAEVGAAIDTNSFIQNAHTQDIDTQYLCTQLQNTGTKTPRLCESEQQRTEPRNGKLELGSKEQSRTLLTRDTYKKQSQGSK